MAGAPESLHVWLANRELVAVSRCAGYPGPEQTHSSEKLACIIRPSWPSADIFCPSTNKGVSKWANVDVFFDFFEKSAKKALFGQDLRDFQRFCRGLETLIIDYCSSSW